MKSETRKLRPWHLSRPRAACATRGFFQVVGNQGKASAFQKGDIVPKGGRIVEKAAPSDHDLL